MAAILRFAEGLRVRGGACLQASSWALSWGRAVVSKQREVLLPARRVAKQR